jgi:signal transduction histidine kinase/CHASE2 domain-containing sensor protein
MIWNIANFGWRFAPGGLAALFFAFLLKLGALQSPEQAVYNAMFRLRGERDWDERLAVITIDDASLKRLGRFPLPRKHYAQLLDRLSPSNAAVVVFNLLWSESSPDDSQLAAAIARNGRVVLAEAWDSLGFPLQPVPPLRDVAITTGHIFNQQDTDGIPRRVELQMKEQPALGLATLQAYSLMWEKVPLPSPNQPLWVNWVASGKRIRQYSFADVLDGKINPQVFRHKIVLVGVTATGLDSLITPFDRSPPASNIYLHATAIQNLLKQNVLVWIPPHELLLILLFSSLGLSVGLSYLSEGRQLLVWAALCVGWVWLSYFLWHRNYWLPVALPLGLLTTTAMAVGVSGRLRTNAILEGQVRQLWQSYRQDLVPHPLDDACARLPFQVCNSASNQSAFRLASLAEQFGRSQSTQAAIARSLSCGLLATDLKGAVWFCNPVAENWLGLKIGDVLTTKLVPTWLDATQWKENLEMLQQLNRVEPREVQRGDRWFEMKWEPLVYQFGQPNQDTTQPQVKGLLLVLEDVTARKQGEVALEQQIAELQRIAQLKDDFLSTVSHELRSPMTNIKMAIQMLKIAPNQESSTRYLKILQAECDRETDLINDLLDLQRLEAGAQSLDLEEINLNEWLPPIIEPFYKRAESHKQSLQLHLPPSFPIFLSDKPCLQRIVVELVNNACKYTPPEGSIRVRAVWQPAYVELTVENSGVEIPVAELPRIFEKFYRVAQSDRWKRGGTGLGLALVKKLVEELKGTIWAHSSAGQTAFIVRLPTQANL